MRYLEWLRTIANGCPQVVNVRGGCMCKDEDGRALAYCDLKTCPKVPEHERS